MKLKSKLIATIVSICAAIAVMGVGVWAATTSFTVTVTNNVNLAFQNLDGTVYVSAATGGDHLYNNVTAPSLTETPIFANGVTTAKTISSAAESAYDEEAQTGGNLQFLGADFLTETYITGSTEYAALVYDFRYESEATQGATEVTIDEIQFPEVNGAEVTTAYYVSLDGQTWTKANDGDTFTTQTAGADIYVKAIIQYDNNDGSSVSTNQSKTVWEFSVLFEAVTDAATSNEFDGTTKISAIGGVVEAEGRDDAPEATPGVVDIYTAA